MAQSASYGACNPQFVARRVSRRRAFVRWSAVLALASHCAAPAAATAVVRVVDAGAQRIADAAVFLTAESPGAMPVVARATAVMDQIDYQFVPHVLVVHTGTDVAFPNSDNVRHHVYSFSAAKRFELPLYAGASQAPVRFEQPGLVTLGCNIHDEMLGYILVVDAPYFGTTDVGGEIRFDELPAGRYDLAVWSARQRDIEQIEHQTIVVDDAVSRWVAITGRLRPPPAPRRPGALWKAY
jgi:plastocyanin